MKFNFLTSKKDSFLKSWFKSALFFALIISLVLSSSFTYSATNYIPLNKESALVYTFAGSGTEDNPYLIESATDLTNFSTNVNNGTNYAGKYIKLTTNINLNNNSFTPIGGTYSFQGTFDGDNHIIEGLYVNANWDGGLFGSVWGATIKNIIVSGTIVLRQSRYNLVCIGGIAGSACLSTFYNCSNWCEVDLSTTASVPLYAGGIVGLVGNSDYETTTTIELCKNLGSVTAYGSAAAKCYAGGICGAGSSSTKVLKCCNYGSITAGSDSVKQSYAGGISGGIVNSVTDCYNMGNVTSTARKTESKKNFSFSLSGSGTCRIATSGGEYSVDSRIYYTNNTKDYNTKYVPENISVSCKDTTNAVAGGICGAATNGAISNCYNYGTVTGGEKYVYISSSPILQYMISVKNPYSSNNFYARELWLDFQLRCYAGISYASIDAFNSTTGTSAINNNCYYCKTGIYNQSSILDSEITTLGFYNFTDKSSTGYRRSLGLDYLKSGYSYSKWSSLSNIKSKSLTNTHDDTNFNSGSNIQSVSVQVSVDSNNYLNINIPIDSGSSSYSWNLSCNISEYSYKYLSDTSVGVSYLTSNTLPSGFSTDVWAINPSINNGYPYLKEMYWQ